MDRSSHLCIQLCFVFLFGITLTSTCPVSPRCNCSSDTMVDITCDLSKNGLPTFNGHNLHVSYKTVVIKGSAHLPNFLFYGLRVKGVQLINLNITYVPCHLFSGLEADLRRIDLSDNLFKSVPSCTLIGLDRVTHLNLSRNDISTIDADSFSWLPSLVSLDLSHNKITDIGVDSFTDFPSLVKLDISWNRIASVPSNAFQGLHSALILNISGNLMLEIRKDMLTGLSNLEVIDISRNKLVRIHDNTFQPTNSLKTLDLSHNQLTLLTIRHIERLQNLSLRNNGIQRLAEYVFINCRELQDLDLSGNSMFYVPGFILSLPKLRRFSVTNNKIESLQFPTFTKLKHPYSFLDFAENNISSVYKANIPAESIFTLRLNKNRMKTMPNLTVSSVAQNFSSTLIDLSFNLLEGSTKIRCVINHSGENKIYLNLSNNKLKTVKNLQPDVHSVIPVSLSSTRISFDLSKNLFETFPPCTFFLRYKLDVLDLSSNLLTWLPKGGCIGSSVRNLLLNGNKLTSIERIFFGGILDNVPILTSVSFLGNRIASISPDAFDGLSSLQTVDLRHNVLKVVPQKLLSLSSLDLFRLEGNPLNCDCSNFGQRTILSPISVVDNARCASPPNRRAYLFKCVLYTCSKTVQPLTCSEDNFVGLQVSIRHLGRGFSISWHLYGPGKTSSIRLNVTDGILSAPVYIHLIDPRINNFTFVNIIPGHNYSLCVEVLAENGVRLNSRCFSGLKFVETKTEKENNSKMPPYNNWLVIVCFVLALLLIALCIYVGIRCRHSNNKAARMSMRNSRLGWRERSNSSLIIRMLQCMKLSRMRYDIPSGNSVIMSDLLLNEHYSDAERHAASDRNPQRVSVDQNQPPLPPRNTSLTESVSEPLNLTSATGTNPGKDPDSVTNPISFKTIEDPKEHNRNVYESGFNLRVRLDKPELSSLEVSAENSEDENIYEDTTPLDSPIVKKTNVLSSSSLLQRQQNGTSSSHSAQGAIPKVIYTQPNLQKENKVCNLNGSKSSLDSSDPYVSGYECPVIHDIPVRTHHLQEDKANRTVPQSAALLSDTDNALKTSSKSLGSVGKCPTPAKRNKQVPILNNPTYSKMIPKRPTESETPAENKDENITLQKSCIPGVGQSDLTMCQDYISTADVDASKPSDIPKPACDSPVLSTQENTNTRSGSSSSKDD